MGARRTLVALVVALALAVIGGTRAGTAQDSLLPAPVNPAEPGTQAATLGGNAFDLLPPGEAGEVSVVLIGDTMQDDFIAVVVRNNTAEAIHMVDVTMIILSADGVLIDAHQTRLLPLTVNPGEYGLFGFDFTYDPIELPDGFTVEFDIDAVSPADFDMLNWFTDLEIESATFQDGMIVGAVRNPSAEAAGPGTVARGFVVCLDTDGRLTSWDMLSPIVEIPAGGTAEVSMEAPADCTNFLFALRV